MIKIFFRYDDYSSGSPTEVDSGLIKVMRQNNIACTYAVIPSVTNDDCERPGCGKELLLTREKIEVLKSATRDGAVEIGLHGWNHRTNKHSLSPYLSEFKGLSLKDQIGIIRRGYYFLAEEIEQPPKAFIPPWNGYDKNTLRALEHVGIPVLSANRFGTCNRSINLLYAPITTEFDLIGEALQHARKSEDSSPIIGVMIHPYNFSESNDSRASFDLVEFDSEIRHLIGCDDITITSINALANDGPQEIDQERYRKNRPSILENAYPSFIEKTRRGPIYLSPHHAGHVKARKDMVAGSFYAGIALVALLGSLLLFSVISGPFLSVTLYSSTIAGIGILLLLIRCAIRGVISKKSMTLIAVLCGILISLIV